LFRQPNPDLYAVEFLAFFSELVSERSDRTIRRPPADRSAKLRILRRLRSDDRDREAFELELKKRVRDEPTKHKSLEAQL
jgi:hypothetical protein